MGHETTLAQVVADELSIDLDDVMVIQGDTAVTPYGLGSWGSRTAVIGGGSCTLASRKLKNKLITLASHLSKIPSQELRVGLNGCILTKDGKKVMTLRDVAEAAYYLPHLFPRELEPALLETTGYFDPPLTTTTGFNASAAMVEVDRETGKVKILRYVSYDDSGRLINPAIVEGQVIGGIAQGIGGVFYEDLPYDDEGHLLASTFTDYLLPTAMEIPSQELGRMTSPSPCIPGGFKGAGEGGVVHPVNTITSAVANALQTKVVETPLSPLNVWLISNKNKPTLT